MKLKKAVRIGKSCGLNTINECILNVEIHSMNFFVLQNIDKELSELDLDITNLAKEYNCEKEDVLKWTICEYNLYV